MPPPITPTMSLAALMTHYWEGLREQHPELPHATVSVSSTPLPAGHGWDRWVLEGETLSPVAVSRATMERGAKAVATALRHEAAHALCLVRGVADTSRRGMYHNRRFVDVGREVGLQWPAVDQPPHSSRGWADLVMDPEMRDDDGPALEELQQALDRTVQHIAPTTPVRGVRTDARLLAECGCARKIRVSAGVLDLGPIVCGLCRQEFKAASSLI
jgi:hypothetical protein